MRDLPRRVIYRARHVGHSAQEALWTIPYLAARLRAAEVEKIPADTRRVLFVCKGNICRSAFAEVAAQGWRAMRPAPNIDVRSAGLAAAPGTPSPDDAIRAALAFGVHLVEHRAQRISPELGRWADLVAVMEPDQITHPRMLVCAASRPVVLLGAFLSGTHPRRRLADPWGKGACVYRECYTLVHDATRSLLATILAQRPQLPERSKP